MQREVSQIPTVELKALAFDLIKQQQFIQNQLSIIEQELIKRSESSQPDPMPTPSLQ